MAWAQTRAEDSVPTLRSSPGSSVLPGTQGPEWAQWTRHKVEDNIWHDARVQPPSCPLATTAQRRDREERGLQQHELRVLLPMHSLTAPPRGSGRGSWSGAGPSAPARVPTQPAAERLPDVKMGQREPQGSSAQGVWGQPEQQMPGRTRWPVRDGAARSRGPLWRCARPVPNPLAQDRTPWAHAHCYPAVLY